MTAEPRSDRSNDSLSGILQHPNTGRATVGIRGDDHARRRQTTDCAGKRRAGAGGGDAGRVPADLGGEGPGPGGSRLPGDRQRTNLYSQREDAGVSELQVGR